MPVLFEGRTIGTVGEAELSADGLELTITRAEAAGYAVALAESGRGHWQARLTGAPRYELRHFRQRQHQLDGHKLSHVIGGVEIAAIELSEQPGEAVAFA